MNEFWHSTGQRLAVQRRLDRRSQTGIAIVDRDGLVAAQGVADRAAAWPARARPRARIPARTARTSRQIMFRR